MPQPPQDLEIQARSLYAVRRALGILGLALPIVLYGYARIAPPPTSLGMQPSISEFYHTHMGDILVGTLSAIGVFLIAYLGYPPKPGENRVVTDFWVSSAAGLGAIGVALFPVAWATGICPPGQSFETEGMTYTCPVQGVTSHAQLAHFGSAALFFGMISVMCLWLFPRDRTGRHFRTVQHRVFALCGGLLLFSAVALLVVVKGPLPMTWRTTLIQNNAIFWLESLGVFAFAIAWLVKGQAMRGLTQMLQSK
ncbi:hypothetical protein [Anianabacter salinae]|uniref:hypothetical protein n=1 Tax=Anianabacter salinae TaxID=2851023 RepID=UPI00225E47CD|nr:hypothetical protein [Anianabacter salinae]MBV0913756.1 hypothetical protein [Anianabacter salinae]